jgi:hypothetical protein
MSPERGIVLVSRRMVWSEERGIVALVKGVRRMEFASAQVA